MPDLERETLVVSAAAFTDTGQARTHNEDYVAYHVPKQTAIRVSHGALFIVCDGVGGGAAGEVASEHAVRRILNDYYRASTDQHPLARLLAAVQQANADIYHQNADGPEARRMTTTVVAGVLVGPRLFVVHAGDSRAYLARAGQITQLTQDHSWVAEMVRSGDLTPAEAEAHPWRNRITRALGAKETVDLEAQTLDVAPGDRLVFCSDGLTRHVTEAEIAEQVSHFPAHLAAQQLISLANQRGGSDNISVLAAEILSPGEARTRESAAPTEKAPAPPKAGRSRAVLPLAVAGGLALIILVAAFIFARGSLLRRSATPTPAAGEKAPAVVLDATATSPPLPTESPTPTPTTPAPTATLRPTPSPMPTATRTPIPPTKTPAPTSASTPSAQAATTPLATAAPTHGLLPTLTLPTLRAP